MIVVGIIGFILGFLSFRYVAPAIGFTVFNSQELEEEKHMRKMALNYRSVIERKLEGIRKLNVEQYEQMMEKLREIEA